MDGQRTFASYLDLTILAEYPWFCQVPALRKLDLTSGSHYIPFLQAVNERIIASENRAVSNAPPGAPITLVESFGLSNALIPGHGLLQSLVAHKATSVPHFTAKISNLASLLLHYRLYDIVTALSSPDLICIPSGQPYKYSFPDPGKIHYKMMSNWSQVIQQGLKAIHQTSYFENTPHQNGTHGGQFPLSQAGVTHYLFSSLSARMQEVDGQSILSNFESAALYMTILYQTKDRSADIPNTVNELCLFLTDLFVSKDEDLDSFLRKIKKPQTFKLPLYIALAVSPICLFLPVQLMKKEVARLNLLLMWQGLGGVRPQSLLHVEIKIYKALVDVALGICVPPERFRQMFNELGSMSYDSVPFTEVEWLAPREESPFKLRVGQVNPQSPHPSTYQHPFDPATTTASQGQGHSNVSFEPIRVDDSILDVNPSTASQQGIKRSSHEALPQRPKRSRKGLAVVHDAVDLTAEREVIAVRTVESTVQPAERYELKICLSGPEPEPSCCSYATFYSISEKDRFQMIWNLGQQFLRNPTPGRRCVQFVKNDDLRAWSNSLGQATLRGKINVVVYDLPPVLQGGGSQLDKDALRVIAPSFQRIVRAYVSPPEDFSLPMHDRETHVMLESFLKAVLPPTMKVIRSAQFPISVAVDVPGIFASHVMAWDATFNQPWCRRHEMPLNTLRFGSGATASAYKDFRVASQGFGVYLQALVGVLWLLLVDRGDEESIIPLEHTPQGHGGNVHYEPVRLHAGTGIILRPGTAFFLFAVDHSVFSGSYWYASSTLTATAISIIREFVGSNPGPPSSSIDMGSARLTLRRLVHFYHMVYTTGLYFSRRTSDECAHTPDLSTPEGLENLLSLCNLMELGNILAGDDYTHDGAISESERQDIIEARRLCRRMVDWVRRHFIIIDQLTKQEQSLYGEVWMPYLARFIRVILESKATEARSRLPRSNEAQATISILNASFSGPGSEVLQGHIAALDSGLANSNSLDLLFPGFRSISIQQRDKPLPDDQDDSINGETVLDANYYRILAGLRAVS
ncbi:hypothetical protein FA13DRAFT_1797596 [Coprinellus micaceus]|uniref:Uncharacterized protein n=1 Tax=Coprinellus micaceus TaxID=71717 RepID=A0A4Y7SS28_COPMI|nr:hypothetical protein FA13DRAFT_1797596 [Coprinellus micaceus]